MDTELLVIEEPKIEKIPLKRKHKRHRIDRGKKRGKYNKIDRVGNTIYMAKIHKSCKYCFNLKLKNNICKCFVKGFERIYFPESEVTLLEDFRNFAKPCLSYDC